MKKRIQISLPSEQLHRLENLAKKREFTKSNLISLALDRFLDEQEYIYSSSENDKGFFE